MSKKNKQIKIYIDYCKECGLCIINCKENALEYSEEFNPHGYHPVVWQGDCSFCGRCHMICPDCAIEIIDDNDDNSDKDEVK